MATGSLKLGDGGAMGVVSYMAEDRIMRYYTDEKTGERQTIGLDDAIFEASQVKGKGVEAMGLDLSLGYVTFGQVKNMLEGRRADTGEQLVKPGYRHVRDAEGQVIESIPTRTMCIDTYQTAKKDVSVLLVVLAKHRPELVPRLIEAHQDAVNWSLDRVEERVDLARRTVATPTEAAQAVKGGTRLVTKPGHERRGEVSRQQGSKSIRVPVHTVRIQATQFTARPTSDRMADVHLHSHNVWIAAAYDPVTGKHVQIDDQPFKSRSVEREADYQSRMLSNLHDMGIETEHEAFEEGRNGRLSWRVKGIPQEAIDFFSSNRTRSEDLVRELEEKYKRAISGKGVQRIMRASRQRKTEVVKAQDSAPDYDIWINDAAEAGITLADDDLIRRLDGPMRPLQRAPFDQRLAEFERRMAGPEGLAKDNAWFNLKQVHTAVARCAEGLDFDDDERLSVELEAMRDLVLLNPEEVELNPAKARYATKELLGLEAEVQDDLAARASRHDLPRPRPADVLSAMHSLPVHPDQEQIVAIRRATSGEGLTLIQGYAGTGKTTILKAVVAAGRPAGGGTPRDTWDQVVVASTAALTAQNTGERIGADEACSIRSLIHQIETGKLQLSANSLLIVDESGQTNTFDQAALLKVAGDAQVIMLGDPEQAQAIGPGGTFQSALKAHDALELTNVYRQNDAELIEGLHQLRQGAPAPLIARLDVEGRFHVAKTATERVDQALAFYEASRSAGRSADDVRLILDSSNKAVDECNRHIQRNRRDRGEIAPSGFTVDAHTEDRRWTLHRGDSVMFLRPYGRGRERVRNGSVGRLVELDTSTGNAVVRLDSGRLVDVRLEASAQEQPLGLSYAVHVQKFQGGQAKAIGYLPGATSVTDKNRAYSAASRCIEELHVFTDRETHGEEPDKSLNQAWSRSPDKSTALSKLTQVAEPAARGDLGGRLANVQRERHELILKVAGEELAGRIQASPAYKTLLTNLDGLRRVGADEQMLRRALHQRGLDDADDPAAVLVYRLRNMQPAQDLSAGLPTPANSPASALRQDRHLELQRDALRKDYEAILDRDYDDPGSAADRHFAAIASRGRPAPGLEQGDPVAEMRRSAERRQRAAELERQNPERSAGLDFGMI